MSLATSPVTSSSVAVANRATDAPAVCTVDRKALLAALRLACKVSPRRAPCFALTHLRLTFDVQSGLTIEATDLATSLAVDVDGAEVSLAGVIMAPAHELLAAVRESAAAFLTLDAMGGTQGTLQVRGQSTFAELIGGAEWPRPIVGGGDWLGAINVSGGALAEILAGTVDATDNESSRYALGGCMLELEVERFGDHPATAKLLAIGTDGSRLHRVAADCFDFEGAAKAFPAADHTGNNFAILPAPAAKVLIATLKGRGADVTVAQGAGGWVKFSGADFTLCSRLLEGRYPRWRDVVPSRSDAYRATALASDLLSALKAAKAPAVARQKAYDAQVKQAGKIRDAKLRRDTIASIEQAVGLGVDLTFGGDCLKLQVEDRSGDDSRVIFSRIIPAATPAGSVETTLNPAFLIDFLKTLGKGDLVSIDLVDADSSVLLRSNDGAGNALCVVMPLARSRS